MRYRLSMLMCCTWDWSGPTLSHFAAAAVYNATVMISLLLCVSAWPAASDSRCGRSPRPPLRPDSRRLQRRARRSPSRRLDFFKNKNKCKTETVRAHVWYLHMPSTLLDRFSRIARSRILYWIYNIMASFKNMKLNYGTLKSLYQVKVI